MTCVRRGCLVVTLVQSLGTRTCGQVELARAGDVMSYLEMCSYEGVNLQKGMNFRLRNGVSVILMSLRPGAPYADRIEEGGRILIYEGHDVPKRDNDIDPKTLDQQAKNPTGTLSQNGLFYEAAVRWKRTHVKPELVKVYEKIRPGMWVYNGLFTLVDAWRETSGERRVFKFKLELIGDVEDVNFEASEIDHTRLIPAQVKMEVWKRDKGRCVLCGSTENLHFDHIIPYSKGGSSLVGENIRLLCATHNLAKRDKIDYQ
ncbi:MAG: HNH endonuclease [Chloroflexi bacterium]|nr:HNH endonuclease [Chloroflexota bacterium]